jgi:hypothetical protein
MRRIALALTAIVPFALACDPQVEDPSLDGPELNDEDVEPEPAECVYPASGGLQTVGSIMPAMSWDPSYLSATDTLGLDLEELYCERQEQVDSIVFILVTEWCPNCPQYVQYVNGQAAAMAANGAQIVWVDLQDRAYQPATSLNAQNYISNKIGDGVGYRVGSADASSPVILNSPIWSGVPNAIVVRTSDMKVVAAQEYSQYMLDFASITANIDLDDPTNPPFQSACGADGDEEFEPNNAPNQAGQLTGGATVSGGICDEEPDFYRVDSAGSWRLDLEFTHAVGDLDVYVMDEATMQPVKRSESTDDNESIDHEGPALIQIVGYQGSSAPYTLRLNEL